jgi:hypothetical protein
MPSKWGSYFLLVTKSITLKESWSIFILPLMSVIGDESRRYRKFWQKYIGLQINPNLLIDQNSEELKSYKK